MSDADLSPEPFADRRREADEAAHETARLLPFLSVSKPKETIIEADEPATKPRRRGGF